MRSGRGFGRQIVEPVQLHQLRICFQTKPFIDRLHIAATQIHTQFNARHRHR
jgi:hypothetical protein